MGRLSTKTMLFGIEVAAKFGFWNVVVENDFLHLINSISSRERGGSSFHLILDDVVHANSMFDVVYWSFVHREGNNVAHELAHCLPWVIAGRKFWLVIFSNCIDSLLVLDITMNVIYLSCWSFPKKIFFL